MIWGRLITGYGKYIRFAWDLSLGFYDGFFALSRLLASTSSCCGWEISLNTYMSLGENHCWIA